jgi:biopolymer transport protein ExbD
MTPLVDVVFLLMIFFLLTINFQKPEGVIHNELPRLDAQNRQDTTPDWETVRLRVKLVRENQQLKIYLQERVVTTYDELLEYLNQLPNDILIIIEADGNVPYKHVIGVYNACLKSEKKDVVFSIAT